MKPAPFRYHAPTTLDEAMDLLSNAGEDGKVLAGGQSLVPMLNMRLTRFDVLVDITRIAALRTIDTGAESVRIGAGVRDVEIEESCEVGDAVPLLKEATRHVGHFQVRNRGTLCGSVAHADPTAEYPCVAVTLGAEMQITGPSGSRREAACDFFSGTWQTTLATDELLVAVSFPRWSPNAGFGFEEVARREGDFAIAGAAAAIEVEKGVVSRVAIGLFGLGATPLRGTVAEKAMLGAKAFDVDLEDVGRLAVENVSPPGDLHASGALRRRIGAAVARRALTRAFSEASARSES